MMALRWIGGVSAVLLAAWLQVSWFGHLRPFGIIPNLMMLVVIAFALWWDATPTLAAAVGGGLLLDLASGADFGLNMAFLGVVALALIAGRQLGLHTAFATITPVVVAAVIMYNVVILASLKASLNHVAISRIGRELAVDLMLMALIALIAVTVSQRQRVTADLGIGGR